MQTTLRRLYIAIHGVRLVAQKIRTKDKNFPIIGDGKGLPLYGSHLWSNGKKLVITEGEIDAMSVSQLQNHKWPVVSLPQGAAGAVRAIKDNWDYVLGFDEIVLMFDQDDKGREAARRSLRASSNRTSEDRSLTLQGR